MKQQAINYEVADYNKAVRDDMKEGERHPFLKDDCADIHGSRYGPKRRQRHARKSKSASRQPVAT
jgi:hypothetical protein